MAYKTQRHLAFAELAKRFLTTHILPELQLQVSGLPASTGPHHALLSVQNVLLFLLPAQFTSTHLPISAQIPLPRGQIPQVSYQHVSSFPSWSLAGYILHLFMGAFNSYPPAQLDTSSMRAGVVYVYILFQSLSTQHNAQGRISTH